jgi:membrane fusion protein, multidrug efflux system
MRNLFIILALAVLALGLSGCGGSEETQAAVTTAQTGTTEPPPLPADVADVTPAETGTIVSTGTAGTPTEATANTLVSTGEFVSPVRSELAPKMPGRVARVYVDEGSRVTRGQPLLMLETDYVRLNLQSAEAEASRAKAMLDEAQRDLERKRELIAKNSIPRATFDRSQANFDQARAAHAGALAQASLLRQQLADSTVRSPISGVVAEKRTDVGMRLGEATVAFVVVQISPLKLRFSVPERYLGKIRRGHTVTARVDPYPNEAFAGTIKTVGGVIDPRTRTMFAEAEFPNADGRLRPGLFARVEAKLN